MERILQMKILHQIMAEVIVQRDKITNELTLWKKFNNLFTKMYNVLCPFSKNKSWTCFYACTEL